MYIYININIYIYIYIYILGCIVCPSPAQILDFFGLQVENHQYKMKIKFEVISSFFLAMVSNTVFWNFLTTHEYEKMKKKSNGFET